MTDYRPRFLAALLAQKQAQGKSLSQQDYLDVCHTTAEILIAEAVDAGKIEWEKRRKERKKSGIHPLAEKVYDLYPKKSGKDAALQAITKALQKHSLEYLLDKTAQFAACVAAWPSSYRYFQDGGDRVWNPVNFYRDGHHEDDASEWKRKGSRTAPPTLGLQEPEGWRFAHPESRPVTDNIPWVNIDRATQQYIIDHTPQHRAQA